MGYTSRAIAVDPLKFIFWDIGGQIFGYTGRKYQIVGYTGRKYNRSKSGWYTGFSPSDGTPNIGKNQLTGVPPSQV